MQIADRLVFAARLLSLGAIIPISQKGKLRPERLRGRLYCQPGLHPALPCIIHPHHIMTSDVTASAWNVEMTLGSCGNGLGSLDRFPSPSTTTAPKTIRHGFQTSTGPS